MSKLERKVFRIKAKLFILKHVNDFLKKKNKKLAKGFRLTGTK